LVVEVEGDKIVIRKASGGLPRIRLGLRLTPEEIDRLVEEGVAKGSSRYKRRNLLRGGGLAHA
jgi:antitoxin PrlF